MKTIRWGVMGPGSILDRWILGARQLDDMEVVALGSRKRESGQARAEKNGIERVLTLDELLNADDIDAIYITVPHNAHMEYAIAAMEHGKHVLVEKPIAVHAGQVRRMIECAQKNRVLLMEGVWTRFFPAMKRLKEALQEGFLGEARALYAPFAYNMGEGADRQARALNPELAGGGLLDVGVYPLHFASFLYEALPEEITGVAAINSDEKQYGVDEQAAYVARYPRGRIASMASGVCTNMEDTALIYGTKGSVRVPSFWKPTRLLFDIEGNCTEESFPISLAHPEYLDEGFQYEISHFNECIRDSIAESPIVPLSESLGIIEQCDRLRAQWGLRYPFE